jgi:hypothetical protein
VVVEDRHIDEESFEAPVFLCLEDLAHEMQIVLLDDPYQEDGEVSL